MLCLDLFFKLIFETGKHKTTRYQNNTHIHAQSNSKPLPPNPPCIFSFSRMSTSGWANIQTWSLPLNLPCLQHRRGTTAPVNQSCANGLCTDAKTCGPVSESINHQECTWTHYVTRCFRPSWFCSRSTVQHTCSYVLGITKNTHSHGALCILSIEYSMRPVSVISLGKWVV